MNQFIAYFRVSTKGQGESGLGMDAQRKAVADFVEARAGRVIAEFTEVESGKNDERPELIEALKLCKLYKGKARLVVAKLDRLSRSAAFLTKLQEAKVPFVCCDMPEADELIIGVMALIARWERDKISQRTKDALAARKARGKPHNGRRAKKGEGLTEAQRAKGERTRIAAAKARAEEFRGIFEGLQAEGIVSHSARATILNQREVPTPSGEGEWHPQTVKRVVEKLGPLDENQKSNGSDLI